MNFRYDINALRAIAVLSVVLFHFDVSGFNGGFIGVDIFFVISGYLMTRIIISSLVKAKFSVWEFYSRRVKRIIPALLFAVAVVTLIGFFVYLPVDFRQNCRNALGSILFISNIMYWKNSNYFDPSSDNNIFLHTWSLSVEWQFYLLYPIVLLGAYKLFNYERRKYLVSYAVLIIILYIFNIWATREYPTSSFYLLPTRAWEMMCGGMIFFAEDFIETKKKVVWVSLLYCALLLPIFAFDENMAWPGSYALIPVAITGLIVLLSCNNLFLIRNKVMQYLGKISYSLYLWHWPVYVFCTYLGFQNNLITTLILLMISLILAVISYHFIESLEYKNPKLILVAGILGIIILSVGAGFDTNEFRYKKETLLISVFSKTHTKERSKQFSSSTCFVSSANATLNKDTCLLCKPGGNNVLLLGDSHGAHFSQSIRQLMDKLNGNLLQATASGCFPLLHDYQFHEKNAKGLIKYIYIDYLKKNRSKIKLVLISANWVATTNVKKLGDEIEETLKYLNGLGIKALVIGQNETYTMPYESIAAREHESGKEISARYINTKSLNVNNYLKVRFSKIYIDIYMNSKIDRLSTVLEPYMSDKNHFTKYGADQIVNLVLSRRISEIMTN